MSHSHCPVTRSPGRAGITLVEMIVVMLLLSLLAGISGLAIGRYRPGSEDALSTTARARDSAIRWGKAVRLSADSLRPMLFLPDGRVVGGGFDPLTGAPKRER